MAKPRNSVLYLFDPLHQSPSTARRDSSPELGTSDKENDLPPGDVTVFFDRIYTAPKLQGIQPHTPKGKLIDIGDTPAQDSLWDETDHDGSDADEEQSENEPENSSIIFAPLRSPLAELDVEATPRPQQDARRPLQAPVFASAASSFHNEQPIQALFAAPQGSPLAEVINSITFAALTVSEDAVTSDTSYGDDGPAPSPFPVITVCAPETPSTPAFDLGHDDESTKSSTVNGSTLRPSSTLTQLSPDDLRRASVDLYSSFHLQMQSADMSFDLLNDKISFLGSGHDSFWAGGEDAMFDFDEENRAPIPKEVEEKLLPVGLTLSEGNQHTFSPPNNAVRMTDVASSPTVVASNVPLPSSPPSSAPSSRDTPPLMHHTPLPPTSPVSFDEPSLMLESEPMPPKVPALRILKKTFTFTGRPGPAVLETSDTGSATRRTDRVTSTEKRQPIPGAKTAVTTANAPIAATQSQPPRPNYRGVQRPPASMLAAGVVIGLPPQGSSHNTSASTSSSSSTGTLTSRAPRTLDRSRFATVGPQRPVLASQERTTPRGVAATSVRSVKAPSSTAGIARAASASTAVPRAIPSTVSMSGLRPPSHIAMPAAGSAHPRPASRLPGPSSVSGLARHTSTGSGIGTTRPRAVTAPRAPTGGRF
ncbi:hypothetical protein BC628DRAFT_33620 [Trametes gibbosa]|nr:hypothetical protein BC628DRAFT_33620 [Trametes gibbosa]